MTIEVYKLLKKEKVTDYEAGARIFNLLKEHVEKDPNDFELTLDFKKVLVFTQVPFKTLISSMKSRLEGEYQIKLINQTELINQAFKNSLK